LSAGFRARNTTDAKYVTILNKAFFGRDLDSWGYNSWLSQPSIKTSRDQALDGFIQSDEFAQLRASCAITAYLVGLRFN